MAIAFDAVPANARVPLFWPEIRPAQSPYIRSLKMLLIGRATEASTGDVDVPTILSAADAAEMWGRGSMLAHMYEVARMNGGPFIEIWGMALPKDVAFVAATGSITVTATAPKDSSLAITLGGRTFFVIVRKTDTTAQIATKIKNAINTKPFLYVTAAVEVLTPTRVDLTCRWKGVSGNRIDITLTSFGNVDRVARKILTVVQLAGGVGEPSISGGLAKLGAQEFDVIVPADYTAPAAMAIYEDFMNGSTGRWSPSKQLYGHFFVGYRGSLSAQTTFGDLHNDPHISVIGVENSPSPAWLWGAALGAVACIHWAAPPEISRPLHTLQLQGVIVPTAMESWWDLTERQNLIDYGISTFKVGDNRQPVIDRVVTLRKTNAWGDPDPSWLDAVTMFQAAFFTRFMRSAITGAFPRSALTTENTGIPGFASPEQIKNVILVAYLFLVREGLVENYPLFAEALIVERNAIDANRVDIMMRPDLVNQLVIVAAAIETHLQLNELSLASTRSLE